MARDLEHILAQTSGVWEDFRGQNVFITGGTGFFGRWLLESFSYANETLDLKARLVVLSRDPEAFARQAPHLAGDSSIDFVAGDVRNFNAEAVRSQLRDAPAEYAFVIHAATEASAKLNRENPLLMIDTVVQGTRATLEFAVAHRTKRFLLTSSGAIYGRQPAEMTHIPEEYLGGPDCTDSNAAYAEAKRNAELLAVCFQKQFGLPTLIARCFAFVGPFLPMDSHFAIGNFIRDALGGSAIEIKSDGTPYRSYLYAADLAIWLWTVLAKGTPGRPYNVGSEDGRSLAEMARVVAATDDSLAVVLKGTPEPGKPPERYVPSCCRAREELGLAEWVDLPEAVRRTMEHARGIQQTESSIETR